MSWTAETKRAETPLATAGDGSRGRRRWYRVRVQTDDGPYVGSVQLDSSRHSLRALRELVEEERVYLGLWDVTREGSTGTDEYLAIHKRAVRFVMVLGPAATPGGGH